MEVSNSRGRNRVAIFPCLKIVFVDVHTNDIVVNLLVFGKTYRLSTQPNTARPLDVGAEVQILALNLPGLILAYDVFDMLWRQSGVGTPLVAGPPGGVYAPDGQVGHLAQQFLVALVGAPAVVEGHHPPPNALNGIPSPALVGFAAHVRPKLVDLTAIADEDVEFGQFAGLDLVDQVRVDLAGLFFKCLITVFLLIDRMRAVSRTPLLLSICLSICSPMPMLLAL